MDVNRFKKSLLYSCLLFLLCFSIKIMADTTKLDPRLNFLINHSESLQSSETLQKGMVDNTIEVIVTYTGDPYEFLQNGAKIRCIWNNMAILLVPLDQLTQLSGLKNVQYIEANKTSEIALDSSIVDIQVNVVRQQFGLTGKDIIIGIIDSGIDWHHDDFITPEGDTRIKAILDMSESGQIYGSKLYLRLS